MNKSPIRYFGGKNGFSNRILEHFPEEYTKMNYIEPFCGSAAMLFRKEKSPIEIINDLDQNIYTLFKILINRESFNQFKDLCDISIYSEQILKEYTLELKKNDMSDLERAYKFFYINRTSYNGVGGFSASGVVRRNMSKSVSDYLSSIDGLLEVHNRLSTVAIHNMNALDLIVKWDKENTFQFCDSPYANETRSSGRYKHDFSDEMQDTYLSTLLSIKNSKLMICGYKCERYEILESNGFRRIDMEIKTQNTNREGKSKVESLWLNY